MPQGRSKAFSSFVPAFLLCLAAGSLHGQVLVSLGAGSGCNALQAAATCTLTARVTGAANFVVAWSFNPTVAGAIIGVPTAPDATGLSTISYKAPNFISVRQTVTVTATSVVDSSQVATVTISLVPATVSVQVNPATVSLVAGQIQAFTASVSGISQTGVTWSISPVVGSIDPVSGVYTAPTIITASQKVTVTATSTFDPAATGTAAITLLPLSVQVTPAAVTLTAGQAQQFTALVTASQAGVIWSINPVVGTIDPNTGVYLAPASILTTQRVSVIATSAADPTVAGTATVTLQPPPSVGVTVSPATASLTAGQTQQFTATVNGSLLGVAWSIAPPTGFIDANGLYTAPAALAGTQKVTLTATSIGDPTKSGSASITLTGGAAATVTVTPATVTLSNNQKQQFAATIDSGTGGVTWSISPQTGTIDNNGVYTAPALITGSPKVTVTATLNADTSKTGTASITLTTVVDVGVGAPGSLQQQFLTAYYRNGFNLLVSLPPLANVKKLGTAGYVQEFSDTDKTAGVKLALATISPTAAPSTDGSVILVVQVLSPLYVYYSTVGAATAGYPLSDSQNCPAFDPANSCVYDLFDKGYALFAYINSLATGQDFAIRAAFYTEWANLGGMAGPGRPVDVETAITSSTATTATVQTYSAGAVYTIGAGTNKGKTFGVVEPLFDLYVSQGGPSGNLGLPTSEVFQAATGLYRQTFEGGALQYTSSGGPTVQLPVTAVGLSGPSGNTATLSLGQTLSLTAVPVASNGLPQTDRPISWSTTNGKVISIVASGQSAVLKAIGGGTASVTASSGGVTSPKITITVISICCQIGDGAPQAVQQAFQDAVARDKLAVLVPAPTAASRVGNGYVQIVPSSDPASTAVYMLTQSDQVGTAYVVSGSILAQYQALGGPAGALGYPLGDANSNGTQIFAANAALAGSPVRLVSGGVLSKWALLGYDAGIAGPPVSDSSDFSTLGANSGAQQSFRGGVIFGASAGPKAGSSFYVSGLILARYTALGGAAGDYGMPVSDEFVTAGLHQQNFEGGNLTYAVGDAAAVEHPAPKVPGVVVAPVSIAAGGQARLAVLGFADNSTIRVSITGSPDFLVTSANGAYSWDMSIPLTAKSGTVTIHAADTKGTATANATLTVKGFVDNRLQIAKVQGDNQTGMPGAALPVSLRIAMKDSSGSPVVGAQVAFQASPGAQLSAASTTTDSFGFAETFLRLPAIEGVTAVTADVPSISQSPVTFYARSAAASLPNFSQLVQAGDIPLGHGTATIAQKGALLTAVASILRYHQGRGELPSPNGVADPATLNQFLLIFCVVDPAGKPLCDGFLSNPDSGEQVVNLWRAAEFTGGVDVTALNPTPALIADRLAQGSPILLSLSLSLNNAPAGGHYLVATGVSADGSIVIQDPSPFFARAKLNDYLNGFTLSGGSWKGSLVGAAEFARRNPSGTRFMVGALSQSTGLIDKLALDLESASGQCGSAIDLLDAVDASGHPAAGALKSRIQVCDGLAPVYQVSVGASQSYRAFATDLSPGGTSTDLSGTVPATYQATRPQLALVLSPQAVSLREGAVVNGATYTTGIAPGGAISIFGVGLSGGDVDTVVDIDGTPAPIVGATPFQINAVLPLTVTTGAHTLSVKSAYGTAQQPVEVLAVSPSIFLVGNPQSGALVNQGGSLNSPGNPALRGQVLTIYATGLGTVAKQGQLSSATTPVSVSINGLELPAAFAGLAPGTAGEYQVNVLIPATTPPGSRLVLTLKQGGQTSNPVTLALQ